MTSFSSRLLSLVALSVASTCASASIYVTPSNQATTTGSSIEAAVWIDALTAGTAPALGAFDLNLAFDPSVLSFSSVSYGAGLDVLGLGSLRFSDLVTPGVLNVGEISFDSEADLNSLQSGAFALFTVTFQAVAAGVSGLSLQINSLSDAAGLALTADTTGASIAVTPVPLPAAAWLLLSGLAGLVGTARRGFVQSPLLAPQFGGVRS